MHKLQNVRKPENVNLLPLKTQEIVKIVGLICNKRLPFLSCDISLFLSSKALEPEILYLPYSFFFIESAHWADSI